MVHFVGEIQRKENLYFIHVWIYHPVLLILSVGDLCGGDWFAFHGSFNCGADWCSKEVSLEHGESVSDFSSDFGALCSDELVFFPDLVGLGFIHCLLYLFGLSEPTSVDLQGDIKPICILIFGTNELRVKLFQHFICTILEKFFWTISFARKGNSFIFCICGNLVDNIVVVVSVFSCQSFKVFGQVVLHELLHNWVRRFDMHFNLLIKILT